MLEAERLMHKHRMSAEDRRSWPELIGGPLHRFGQLCRRSFS